MLRVSLAASLLLVLGALTAAEAAVSPPPPKPTGRAREQLQITAQTLWVRLTGARAEVAALRKRLAREPATVVEERREENPQLPAMRERINELRRQRLILLNTYDSRSHDVRQADMQLSVLEQELRHVPREVVVRTAVKNPLHDDIRRRLSERETEVARLQAEYGAARGLLLPDPPIRRRR